MTPKEQLREKFISVLDKWDWTDLFPHENIARDLLAAMDEIYKPLHITIKPSDEQLEQLRKTFKDAAYATFVYGDPTVTGDNT